MNGTMLLILAGMTALGFLVVAGRRRQMPIILRATLLIAAAAIVLYVGWTIAAGLAKP
jgi:hypothetical protein